MQLVTSPSCRKPHIRPRVSGPTRTSSWHATLGWRIPRSPAPLALAGRSCSTAPSPLPADDGQGVSGWMVSTTGVGLGLQCGNQFPVKDPNTLFFLHEHCVHMQQAGREKSFFPRRHDGPLDRNDVPASWWCLRCTSGSPAWSTSSCTPSSGPRRDSSRTAAAWRTCHTARCSTSPRTALENTGGATQAQAQFYTFSAVGNGDP